MSEYQLTATAAIIRTADGASIPNDPANYDRVEYETWLAGGGVPDPYVAPPAPPQDLMAQFTTDDLTKIKSAVDGSIQFWGLWSAMQAQSEPMVVTNARFLQGWGGLTQVLGAPRMAAIAAALGVTI